MIVGTAHRLLAAELSAIVYALPDGDAFLSRKDLLCVRNAIDAAYGRHFGFYWHPQLGRDIRWTSNAHGSVLFLLLPCGSLFVAFRGTVGIRQWYRNCKIRLTESAIGSAHAGFSTFRGVAFDWWQEFRSSMSGAFDPPKLIVFCGHSAGGAQAAIEATHWAQNKPSDVDKMTVLSFGAPRCVDKIASEWLTHAIDALAFVNQRDVVCRLPSRLFGWRRAGTMVYLCGKRSHRNPSFWYVFWDRFKAMFRTNGVRDHSIAEYLRSYKNHVGATECEKFLCLRQ